MALIGYVFCQVYIPYWFIYMIYKKNCLCCNNEMVIIHKSAYLKRKNTWKFCSYKCRSIVTTFIQDKNCKTCSKKFKPRQNSTKFCSKKCCHKFTRRENHHNWKGSMTQYSATHRWIVRNFGNPKKCVLCGKIGEKTTRRWNLEWSNISGEYKREMTDWRGLCKSCHNKNDKILKQKRAVYVQKNNNKKEFLFV